MPWICSGTEKTIDAQADKPPELRQRVYAKAAQMIEQSLLRQMPRRLSLSASVIFSKMPLPRSKLFMHRQPLPRRKSRSMMRWKISQEANQEQQSAYRRMKMMTNPHSPVHRAMSVATISPVKMMTHCLCSRAQRRKLDRAMKGAGPPQRIYRTHLQEGAAFL